MIKDIQKDKRGKYMLKMSEADRSAIMSKRAGERWAKTTKGQRSKIGSMLAQARQAKKELRGV